MLIKCEVVSPKHRRKQQWKNEHTKMSNCSLVELLWCNQQFFIAHLTEFIMLGEWFKFCSWNFIAYKNCTLARYTFSYDF